MHIRDTELTEKLVLGGVVGTIVLIIIAIVIIIVAPSSEDADNISGTDIVSNSSVSASDVSSTTTSTSRNIETAESMISHVYESGEIMVYNPFFKGYDVSVVSDGSVEDGGEDAITVSGEYDESEDNAPTMILDGKNEYVLSQGRYYVANYDTDVDYREVIWVRKIEVTDEYDSSEGITFAIEYNHDIKDFYIVVVSPSGEKFSNDYGDVEVYHSGYGSARWVVNSSETGTWIIMINGGNFYWLYTALK